MNDYMTTREVAKYLRLNEKKVYALVAEGQLPAARVSGKWLFPRHVIDQWVEDHTVHPPSGVMGALLDGLIVIQGSDDWLLSRIEQQFIAAASVPVASCLVGSLAGIRAVAAGHAHLAACHVENAQVRGRAPRDQDMYLFSLYTRTQGLMFDRSRNPAVSTLADLAVPSVRFATRQAESGTCRLVDRLLPDDRKAPGWQVVGPFYSHLDVALAIRAGRADAGVGVEVAARHAGLDFIPLGPEVFKLAVPAAYTSHPTMTRFLDFLFGKLKESRDRAETPGYDFSVAGQVEILTPAT